MLIINLFNEAQKAFLVGDKNKSKNYYLKIINMEHDRDWKEPQRQLIIDSYLQLIKIAKYNKKVYQDRLQAYSFLGNVVSKASPSKQYSPKYLNKWQSILINGVHYDISDINTLKFTHSLYRWTLLSDKAEVHTVLASPEDFFNKIYPISYFYNSTEKCSFSHSKNLKIKHQVYKNNDCIISPKLSLTTDNRKADSKNIEMPSAIIRQDLNEKKWYHSKWFWIGTAVLTGFVLHSRQGGSNSKKNSKPTHTEGF